MRRILKIFIIPISIAIVSCQSRMIEPFEISVSDYNYSLAYSVNYKLTDKNLTILYRGELENDQDIIIYFTENLPENIVRKISRIDIQNLKENYTTPCIFDGDIKIYNFQKGGENKRIVVKNYYQKDLSPVIELINNIVPDKFKMYHNKTQLLAGQKWCEDDEKEFLKKKKKIE